MSDPARTTDNAAPSVGTPLNRVDGRLKVTGGAKYAAEFALPNVAHAVIVTSTIAKGRVRRMDTTAAERAPGVLAVLTPQNAPRLPQQQAGSGGGPVMRVPTILQDDAVHYNGQPIGLVIADTFEHAIAAANLVKTEYAEERAELDISTAPHAPSEVRTRSGTVVGTASEATPPRGSPRRK
jgi:xanthine dehydrogenase YagR molybdenum-binding subunit